MSRRTGSFYGGTLPPARDEITHLRWALRKFNPDFLMAVLHIENWAEHQVLDSVDEKAECLGGTMHRACVDAEGQVPFPLPRHQKRRWTDEITKLRRSIVYVRRAFRRARRQGNGYVTELALATLRTARQKYRAAIGKAKARSWEKLLLDLNRDLWGRPYKGVRNKLRHASSPTTEGSRIPGRSFQLGRKLSSRTSGHPKSEMTILG